MRKPDPLQLNPLLRVAIALAAGIALGDIVLGAYLPATSHAFDICIGLDLCAMAAAFTIGRRRPIVQSVCILMTTIFVGTTLYVLKNNLQANPLPTDTPLDYEAVIISEPQVRGKTVRCDMMITRVGQYLTRPVKVKAAILRDTLSNNWQELHVGCGMRAVSELRQPENLQQSNFDYARYLWVHGFTAQTFIYWSDWIPQEISLRPLSRVQRSRLRLLVMRQQLLEHYRQLGLDEQEFAVVAAMTLGDKGWLSRQTKDDYSVSGASHILALSGLHLGIIYWLLTLPFAGRGRRRPAMQALAVAAVWLYAALVGLQSSVVRSALMITVFALASSLPGRRSMSVNTLSFAAIVMLIANPLTLWDAGFQMSFLAVLGILVCHKPLCNLLTVDCPWLKRLWGFLMVSVAAQIGTAPLVAYYFGRFSCYFLLTNCVAIPATYAILLGAVAMLLTTPLPSVQLVVAKALAWVAGTLNSCLSAIASLPGASIEGININTAQVWVIYIIIACLIILFWEASKVRHLHRLDAFH